MMDLNKELPKIKLMTPKYSNRGTTVIGGKMSGVVNWNDIRYPQMYNTYKNIVSNFWIPQRIPMTDDVKQWELLDDTTKQAFLRTIGQVATLDSVQTRAVLDFSKYVSEPTYHPIAANIAQQEATHNESYSYVLSSIVPLSVQNKTFDEAKNDKIVIKRNQRVNELYQVFNENPTPLNFFKALIGCVVLEGIYFYSAFCFFYNLARQQKMLNTAKMIGYIQRDEVQHSYFFSQITRYLMDEIPELNNEDNIKFIYDTIIEATESEIEWASYSLKNLPGIELNELYDYIKNLANRRLRGLGLDNYYKVSENAMPWMLEFDDDSQDKTKSDLFESRSTAYKKVNQDNDLDDL